MSTHIQLVITPRDVIQSCYPVVDECDVGTLQLMLYCRSMVLLNWLDLMSQILRHVALFF